MTIKQKIERIKSSDFESKDKIKLLILTISIILIFLNLQLIENFTIKNKLIDLEAKKNNKGYDMIFNNDTKNLIHETPSVD